MKNSEKIDLCLKAKDLLLENFKNYENEYYIRHYDYSLCHIFMRLGYNILDIPELKLFSDIDFLYFEKFNISLEYVYWWHFNSVENSFKGRIDILDKVIELLKENKDENT